MGHVLRRRQESGEYADILPGGVFLVNKSLSKSAVSLEPRTPHASRSLVFSRLPVLPGPIVSPDPIVSRILSARPIPLTADVVATHTAQPDLESSTAPSGRTLLEWGEGTMRR